MSVASAASATASRSAGADDGAVLVRDTKDRAQQALAFTDEEWVAFVAGVKAGEFDFA